MKNWQLAAVVVALVIGFGGPPIASALSTPLTDLKDSQVALNASTATAIAPSGTSSMCVQNTSATCVQIGGSAVTTTTGVAVGSGCAGGQVLCLDAKRAWGISTSGSITVNVISGGM